MDAGIANIALSRLSPKKAGRNRELYFNHYGVNLAIDIIIQEGHQTIAVLGDVAKAISFSQNGDLFFKMEIWQRQRLGQRRPKKNTIPQVGFDEENIRCIVHTLGAL